MIKKTILILSLGLFLFSCSDLQEITDSLKKIDSNQQLILNKLKKLDTVEKNIASLSKPQPNTNNKKNERPKADPNKVYDVADAGSIILGKPDAPVTIVKWTDFQ